MEAGDREDSIRLCRQVHGIDRASETGPGAGSAEPWVALRDGRLVAYATGFTFWQATHGVAVTEQDMCALLLGFAAARPDPVSILLPVRQTGLFHWCLHQGLRVGKTFTLMAMGYYHDTRGCWFPSILY
jgi:hypothetical protein